MRAILALAALLTVFAPAIASAAPGCAVPLERIIQTSAYLTTSMEVHDTGGGRVTLRHRDDPRIVASFTTATPYSSTGLSKSEYMELYERELDTHAKAIQKANRAVETSFFPFEPLAWRIVEGTNLPNVGSALEARMSIRLSEDCLVVATYIAPDSPNLMGRWKDMSTAIADIRTTAAPFVLTTPFEREDTAPSGLFGLGVGYAAPLLVIALLYHAMRHYSRLDPPSLSTRTVMGATAVMALGLAIHQREVFINGFSILKYTDALLMLATCFAVNAAALALAQRAAVLALITGAVTGASLLGSSYIGWTVDPVATGAVGGSMLAVSILGFLAWTFSPES